MSSYTPIGFTPALTLDTRDPTVKLYVGTLSLFPEVSFTAALVRSEEIEGDSSSRDSFYPLRASIVSSGKKHHFRTGASGTKTVLEMRFLLRESLLKNASDSLPEDTTVELFDRDGDEISLLHSIPIERLVRG